MLFEEEATSLRLNNDENWPTINAEICELTASQWEVFGCQCTVKCCFGNKSWRYLLLLIGHGDQSQNVRRLMVCCWDAERCRVVVKYTCRSMEGFDW